MVVFVVVDAWQQQCCGTDFRVGSAVEWQVEEHDAGSTWVGDVLGPQWGERVRYHEEHHSADDDLIPLAGVVRSIHVLTWDREPIPGQHRTYQAAAGTGRLSPTQVIDKWGPQPRPNRGAPPTESFAGWIVELDESA